MRFLSLLLVLGGWAHANEPTNKAARAVGAQFNTVVDFDKQSSVLDTTDADKIRTLVEEAKKGGTLDKVMVAAWPDQEFPAANQKLPKTEVELAKLRAENIRDQVKRQLGVNDVEVYNMGESANWLARALNTGDAKLKKEFVRQGAAPMTQEQLGVFRTNAKAGKAVVMVVME